jgi:hypothetical protein
MQTRTTLTTAAALATGALLGWLAASGQLNFNRRAAAVHAGVVGLGETKVIKVTVVEPLQHYQGSIRNGINSHEFGPFNTAYRVDPL